VVVKKFSKRALPVGRLIALDGEAGYQAETLPPGVHFAYWRWQYSVDKAPLTVIPQGEIGLVVAADGKAMGGERILGRSVRCNAFQDARCAICHTADPGGHGQWTIDHDHRCCPGIGSCGQCVRGLLCGQCNLMLGYANDQPERLRLLLSTFWQRGGAAAMTGASACRSTTACGA